MMGLHWSTMLEEENIRDHLALGVGETITLQIDASQRNTRMAPCCIQKETGPKQMMQRLVGAVMVLVIMRSMN